MSDQKHSSASEMLQEDVPRSNSSDMNKITTGTKHDKELQIEYHTSENIQEQPSEKFSPRRQNSLEEVEEETPQLYDVDIDENLQAKDEGSNNPTRKRRRTRRKKGYDLDLDLDQFDYDSEDNGKENRLQAKKDEREWVWLRRICREFVAMFCPCFMIIRALCRCDMMLFYKLCSTIFAMKAFWSSMISLGICTLFKVHRIIPAYDSNPATEEAYLFGLWTYTGKIADIDHSLEDLIEGEIERIETCQFHMQEVVEDAPDDLFLNDAVFVVARIFATLATFFGFFGMVWVLLLATCQSCCFGRNRFLLPALLTMCSILQSFVFFVFASSVCRDRRYPEQRHCSLQADSGMVFASTFAWLLSALATMKMQVCMDQEGMENVSLEDRTDEKKLDRTFDVEDSCSDDSDSSSTQPSRFEIT
jgi:hypothetical protein